MEITAWIRVVIFTAIMLSACRSDHLCREVSDLHWWILGIAGSVLIVIDGGITVTTVAAMLGSLLIVYDILSQSERTRIFSVILHITEAAMFLIPVLITKDVSRGYLAIPVYYVIFLILYMTGVLRGGADAKCMIVSAVMFLTAPAVSETLIGIPARMESVPLFPLSLLFHAALVTLIYMIFCCLRTGITSHGEVGFRPWKSMTVDDAEKSFVWPKQDVEKGKKVFVRGIPDDGVYDRLRSIGEEKVWVTPLIPFMIPITLAFIFMITVGNLLYLPFTV